MTTIVVSPLTPAGSTAPRLVTLEIYVREDIPAGFDRLEVWRSRSTEAGPFEELTAQSWQPARLPKWASSNLGTSSRLVNVSGEVLKLLLNEQDAIDITFTGGNPLSLTQVANQVFSSSTGRVRGYIEASRGALALETVAPGTAASLRVLPSNAAAKLGLPMEEPDSLAYGRDARIQLVPGKETYTFLDQSGSSKYFYKTRFHDGMTGAVSAYSEVFGAEQAVGLPTADLVVGYLDLVTNSGQPLVGREVSVRNTFKGVPVVDGKLVVGDDLVRRTDSNGHVEFLLVRGQRYTVAIAGTSLVKDVTPPTDADIASFSLVDPAYSEQGDYFQARVPNLPFAERRGF